MQWTQGPEVSFQLELRPSGEHPSLRTWVYCAAQAAGARLGPRSDQVAQFLGTEPMRKPASSLVKGRQVEAPGMNSLGARQGYRGCCRRGHSYRGSGGCHPAHSPTKKRKGKFTHWDSLGVWGLATGGPRLLFHLLTHSCNDTVSAVIQNASISPEMFKKRHANKKWHFLFILPPKSWATRQTYLKKYNWIQHCKSTTF